MLIPSARSGTRCGAPAFRRGDRTSIRASSSPTDGMRCRTPSVGSWTSARASSSCCRSSNRRRPMYGGPTSRSGGPSFPCRRRVEWFRAGAQTRDMSIRPTALFVIDGQAVSPTELSRGPWDPTACHGGPIGVARPLHRSSAGRWHRLAAGPCDGRAHPAGAAASRCESTPRWCDRDGRWRSSKRGSCAHPTAWRWPRSCPEDSSRRDAVARASGSRTRGPSAKRVTAPSSRHRSSLPRWRSTRRLRAPLRQRHLP